MQNKVCLCITTFNRSEQLNRSLERLTRLTLPDEVLIINDGGQDNCEDIVNSFKNRLPIKYIYNHNPDWSICSMARNIGIKNTDCDIIITAEPEILFVTDVIKQMLDVHKVISDKVISAGTVYHMGHTATLHQELIENPIERLKYELVNESDHNTNPEHTNGYAKIKGWQATFCALYKKSWIEDVGGWDEEFPDIYGVDDIDIATRIRIKLGVTQIIDNTIKVIHQYHTKGNLNISSNATENNMNYLFSKNLSVNGFEDIDNLNLIANKNKEWGIIKYR